MYEFIPEKLLCPWELNHNVMLLSLCYVLCRVDFRNKLAEKQTCDRLTYVFCSLHVDFCRLFMDFAK